MTQQYSTLAVFTTDCSSLNIINCLHQLCPSLDAKNHCVIFLSGSDKRAIRHKEKIKSIIEKNFLPQINNQYLFVVEANQSNHIECLKEHPKFIKYNWFIALDSNGIYAPSFLQDILSDIDRYKSDNGDLRICSSDKNIQIDILSKANLHQLIDNKTKTQAIRNTHEIIKDYCFSLNGSALDKELPSFINEYNFALLWLQERNGSALKSGYSFLYKKNNKIFNINNECHGLIQNMFNDVLEILWIVNQQEFVHSYRADENHIYIHTPN